MSKSQALFLIVLASLPIQLGKFFFPGYSYVLGIPIDYRAQAVYFSDIIVVAYVLTSSWQFITSRMERQLASKFWKINKFYLFSLTAFALYLAIDSVLFSVSRSASIYFTFKILEFGLLSIFAARDFSSPALKKFIPKVLAFSLIWESLVVIAQFLFQHSLGLWILGERAIGTTTPDIAHFDFLGIQLLRPYGTFSHPNVLGAYLTAYLIILLAIKPAKKTTILTLSSTTLSFSKGALFALFTAFVITSKTMRQLSLRLALLFFSTLVFLKLISTSQVASLAERLTLIQAAFNLALKNPLFGIGSNNFIIEISKLNLISISEIRLLQPVHNVFLLILVENGVFGLLLFTLVFLAASQRAINKEKFSLFIALVIFASIDHFLWTLEQGLFIFWLSLAFLISSPKKSSS